MELQAWYQVFWSFSSFIFNKQTNLQAWITQEVENLQCLLYIIAKIKYYKKKKTNNTQLDFKFKISNNEKYKVDGIWNHVVYTKKLIIG